METDIKKEAAELVTHGPQTALRIVDNTPIDLSRQGASHTNLPTDTNFWPEKEYHPYYQLNELLEYAVFTLDQATKKRSKRTCIYSLQEARAYLKRAGFLLLAFGAEELQAPLTTVLAILPHSDDQEPDLTLQELKAAPREAIPILEDAGEKIAELIVADEDARYPGCRNDEGELIVGGLSK